MAEKATPAPAAAPVTDTKLNQVALWAMITGVAGLTVGWMIPVPWSLAAVILGHIGLSQLKRGVGHGRGYAIAGLATGYTGIAVTFLAIVGFVALFVAMGPDETLRLMNEFGLDGNSGFQFDGGMGPGMMNP
jgi:hypothetical protein